METALEEARRAFDDGEVPVGCVIVKDGEVIARAHNTVERDGKATSHAEINAINAAAEFLGEKFLYGCSMYVTAEPCAMCAGAIINSRISNLCYGTEEPKTGCCGTNYNLVEDSRFNHKVVVTGGILQDECAVLLTEFFKKRRYEC